MSTEVEEFSEFNIDDRVLEAIRMKKWIKPTEIQQAVIPLMLEKKCCVVQARTGSGKTAAYAIPMIDRILAEKKIDRKQCINSVIIAPTKELCSQALKNIEELSIHTCNSIKVLNLIKFSSFEHIKPLLNECPDIIIGTPTKIVQALQMVNELFKDVKRVIVDEADLIATFGYMADFSKIKHYLPKTPIQVMFLSATMDDSTKELRKSLIKGGEWVRIELPEDAYLPSESKLAQYIIKAEENEKFVILLALLKLNLVRGKTVIFVNSVDRCYKLRLFLEEFGVTAALLNSELPISCRNHALEQFNRGLYNYLIATDEFENKEKEKKNRKESEYGVCRGLDFQCVANVINFDFPLTPQLYIHRVGRTARAEKLGTSLSFVSEIDESKLEDVERKLKENDLTIGEGGSVFKAYQFKMEEVDGFRYRALDVKAKITKAMVRDARLKEIKIELLNSEKLKAYFQDHSSDYNALRHDKPLNRNILPHLRDVPTYMIPESLKQLVKCGTGKRNKNNKKRVMKSGNLPLVSRKTSAATQHPKVKHRKKKTDAHFKFEKRKKSVDPLKKLS